MASQHTTMISSCPNRRQDHYIYFKTQEGMHWISVSPDSAKASPKALSPPTTGRGSRHTQGVETESCLMAFYSEYEL